MCQCQIGAADMISFRKKEPIFGTDRSPEIRYHNQYREQKSWKKSEKTQENKLEINFLVSQTSLEDKMKLNSKIITRTVCCKYQSHFTDRFLGAALISCSTTTTLNLFRSNSELR